MHSLSTPYLYRRSGRALLVGAVLAAIAMAPATASAQSRHRGGGGSDRGHAERRGDVRGGGPRVVVPSRRSYYGYSRYYRPSVNLGFFYGYPGFYGAYGYGPYGYYGGYYPYGWSAPYGYAYDGYAGRPYGGVRLDLPQRDGEVYVDGYFVGTVDDFDGRLQQANLEAGPHRIEVRDPDFEPITFDVNVEPGRTITYRGSMRERRP